MARSRVLYLVRHAIAEERGPKWPDDRERPLTPDGISKMRRGVSGFETLAEPVALILTSPLLRAMQTAEVLSKGLATHPEIVTLELLSPGGSPSAIAAALAKYTKPRSIALVGHEPDLGALAAWLIGAKESVPFKKGGIARIETSDWPATRQSQLVWLATPKMLRRLGR
jgi:phosphohistidine phosphatase